LTYGDPMDEPSARSLRLMQRMDRLGISARDLAKYAGVDRASVASARNGSARPATFGQLEAALDRLEHETGVDLVAAGGPATTSTLTMPDGTRVTFEGDPAGVAVAVATFLAQRANQV